MITCEAVSDRMPAAASGRSEWTAEERAHLASCSECATEWALVSSVSRLGREATANESMLTAQVLERVRQARWEDRRRVLVRRTAQLAGLAIAAVLLLVLLPGKRLTPVDPGAVAVTAGPAELQLAELDDAAPAELEMVLAEFDEPAVPASSLDGPDLDGLNLSQVERALRSWEES
jgi:predicted anti-sigma-YlaC factor YlaD